MSLETFFHRAWYQSGTPLWPLLPVEWLWRRVAAHRYRSLTKSGVDGVPVIVVGNIAVGGTGKTPVVVALAEYLSGLGRRPGIVSRGYGGSNGSVPLFVDTTTDAARCGDEAAMLARRTGLPVMVCADRLAATKALIEQQHCDVIISDDGLQHYKLPRNMEIAVVDGQRGLGNGHCMPVGPLRELPARLQSVDSVVVNGAFVNGITLPASIAAEHFQLRPSAFVRISDGATCAVADWEARPNTHAFAGIGNPGRFFNTLHDLGIDCIAHPMPDHCEYTAKDITFSDAGAVIMTEKDAVKCAEFANDKHWFLRVDSELPAGLRSCIDTLLSEEFA